MPTSTIYWFNRELDILDPRHFSTKTCHCTEVFWVQPHMAETTQHWTYLIRYDMVEINVRSKADGMASLI